MIFIILSTQDKPFARILKEVDRGLSEGKIKDKVIVQAGYTKYECENMEILDLIPFDKFNDYIAQADLIITHGGVGSILSAIKLGKKVIAVARLAKYGEHTNDHQLQVIEKMAKQGYIIDGTDETKLIDKIVESKDFEPKEYTSNTDNFINGLQEQIDKLF